MARYAIVKDDEVVNVVLWDGETDWTPPEQTVAVLVESDDISEEVPVVELIEGEEPITELSEATLAMAPQAVCPGWKLEGDEFVPPEPEESEDDLF